MIKSCWLHAVLFCPQQNGWSVYLPPVLNEQFFIEVFYSKQQHFITALNGFDNKQLLSLYTTDLNDSINSFRQTC